VKARMSTSAVSHPGQLRPETSQRPGRALPAGTQLREWSRRGHSDESKFPLLSLLGRFVLRSVEGWIEKRGCVTEHTGPFLGCSSRNLSTKLNGKRRSGNATTAWEMWRDSHLSVECHFFSNGHHRRESLRFELMVGQSLRRSGHLTQEAMPANCFPASAFRTVIGGANAGLQPLRHRRVRATCLAAVAFEGRAVRLLRPLSADDERSLNLNN
jgi:hypothetical protein